MRKPSCLAGLALLSAFAAVACSSTDDGNQTGVGGSGPGGSSAAGAGGTTGLGGQATGGSAAGAGGGPTGVAGSVAGSNGTAGAAAGRGGSAAGAAGTGGSGGAAAGTAGSGGAAPGGSGGVASGGRGGGAAGTTGVAGAGGSATGGGSGPFGLSGPTRCDTSLPLCESFENGLDTSRWTTRKAGDATVTVDEVHAARGTKALHVKTAAGGSSNFAYIQETKTFPATNNVLYGRMFVWFEDALTTDGHFTLAEGAGNSSNPAVIRFGGQFKAFGVGTDSGSSGDWTDSDKTKLPPTKTWLCTEFQFDGPNNTFHVWWDDMERTMLASGPSKHASFTMPTFNSLWFGWWMYNMAEPQEVWIDEIAVDYKPIGCTK